MQRSKLCSHLCSLHDFQERLSLGVSQVGSAQVRQVSGMHPTNTHTSFRLSVCKHKKLLTSSSSLFSVRSRDVINYSKQRAPRQHGRVAKQYSEWDREDAVCPGSRFCCSILEGRARDLPSLHAADCSQRNGRPLLKAFALQCLRR